MSISSLDLVNQTTLVPNSLLGYSSNGVSALEINPTAITIAGNLNTPTPIYVGISASTGLTTTLSTGLDVNCDFNMNDNNITNLNEISGTTDLTITGSDIYTNCQGLQFDAGTYINLTTNTGNITTTSAGDTQINSDNTTITAVNSLNLNGINIGINATDNVNIVAGEDNMSLTAKDNITLTSTEGSIIMNSTIGSNTITASNVEITSTVGGTQISAPNDSVNIITPQKTYFNLTTELTGDGEINLAAIKSPGDLSIQTGGTDVLSLTSGDNTQVNCGENFTVQTNTNTGIVNFNTGDLFNGGGIIWNGRPMGITFFNKWDGGFNYSTGGTWEMVRQNSITFPSQFLYGTWAVQFSINCSNVGSQPSDKGLAMYFNFIDGGSITYNGFSYNQNFPFAQWFNASGYTNTAQYPLSITYTDYFDFNGAVNNLELQINWYADNPQPQNDFFVSTTFTLMTLI